MTPFRNNLYYLHRDRGYRFTDRDADMEWIVDKIDKSGLSISDIIERILDITDNQISISYNTIARWLDGTTRRPQNLTLTLVARALGYERSWTKLDKG